MEYDDENIFAKILRGEIPCSKVHEDKWSLAFHDISPQTPIHILVVPKGRYVSIDDFSKNAGGEEIAGFFRAVGHVAREAGVSEKGYRILANHGRDAHQEVPHFHVHIFAGRDLGGMVRNTVK
ncbi:MAG: histidine triad nucleotide-binding protein [Rhodospirillaceae bacterium TMED8]|nr:histidine triad nucleotide-binding protein [Magnetovibrio sp.]OUT50403.1 MAG: histidine triad nucleotide-binding protein [Rhodospirillaceae bacterium TMED8]|tara:strand:- start:1265 stop:1633 length:369 start_codon:yes stop_codon:yes gene_type:complete